MDIETYKILLVDDRPENLITLQGILESPELDIYTAHSGNEALGLLLEHNFALVLMDVQMPGMDGFETVSLIRGNKKYKNIPIIYVTGQTEQKFIESAYEEGIVDIIFKPIVLTYPLICKVKVILDLYLKSYYRILLQSYP